MEDGPCEVRGPLPLSHQAIVPSGKGESPGWKEEAHIPAPDGGHDVLLIEMSRSSSL